MLGAELALASAFPVPLSAITMEHLTKNRPVARPVKLSKSVFPDQAAFFCGSPLSGLKRS